MPEFGSPVDYKDLMRVDLTEKLEDQSGDRPLHSPNLLHSALKLCQYPVVDVLAPRRGEKCGHGDRLAPDPPHFPPTGNRSVDESAATDRLCWNLLIPPTTRAFT